ncbi:Pvc16 family protein [Agathobaculum sp. Marseille-P7918]|uniref:Pvc16 family protein n=1 Tax=Agathobaculum sp. Marseille-P7918 TaxID=2479843 RepID=UPI003568787E
MSMQPVFQQAGDLLLHLLNEALVPAVLNHEDCIRITYPHAEQDYQIGIFLYDIEEIRPYGTPLPVRISETQRQGASLNISLHFLVYANRSMAFQSMTAQDEIILMEAVVRALHNNEPVVLEGQKLSIRLECLTRQEKTSLWQSFGSGLQPAIYLVMEPIVIPSTRLEQVIPVQSFHLKTPKKVDGPL